MMPGYMSNSPYQFGPQMGYQIPQMQPQYQPMQAPRPAPLSGRVVNSPDEIAVQDVPTDGSMGWFPSADGSRIWAKRWTADGNISTYEYAMQGAPIAAEDPMKVILGKVDSILAILNPAKEDSHE